MITTTPPTGGDAAHRLELERLRGQVRFWHRLYMHACQDRRRALEREAAARDELGRALDHVQRLTAGARP